MKFLELCAGIGGFRQALENLNCECVGYSELDKHAIKLYSAWYNDECNFGDITKIEAEKLPDFELLAGGFPCQAFSVAGKRLGFDDTRGTIFFDFARIMKIKKPKFAIFENVKGLLNHDGGKTYETMLRTLNEIGYDVQWGILNTRFHGLPQNRERVYIVANLRERSSTKILFERGNDSADKMERTENGIIGQFYNRKGKTHQDLGVISSEGQSPALLATTHKNPRIVKIGDIDGLNTQYSRVYDSEGVSTTINAQGGGLGAKTGLYKVGVYIPESGKRHQGNEIHRKNSICACLKTGGGGKMLSIGGCPPKVRRLTPKECFRLQGFKDEMVELGYKIGISDTQLYKMAGNAVSVPVVEWVAQRVLNWDNLRNADSDYLF